MPNLSFDHAHYVSSDFQATLDFYVGIMGATQLESVVLGGATNLQLALAGVTLLFAPEKAGTNYIEVDATQKLGAFHIAFLVDSVDEATAYYESLNACVALGPLIASPEGVTPVIKAVFLEAPDGMWVELKEVID